MSAERFHAPAIRAFRRRLPRRARRTLAGMAATGWRGALVATLPWIVQIAAPLAGLWIGAHLSTVGRGRGGAALGVVLGALAGLAGAGVLMALLERWSVERFLRTGLANGRLPTCLMCGYDLRGSAADRCPECGFDTTVG